jgi:pimeloyl-ACP methyl ester carboxylesterase
MLQRRVPLIAVAGLILAAAACSGDGGDDGAGDATSAFETDPSCFGLETAGLSAGEVTCGHVTVPADHDHPEGPTIRVAVAVLPATSGEAGDTPVMMLEGGPGGHLVEPALTNPALRSRLSLGPKTVLIDQRGVGLSQPELACPDYVETVRQAGYTEPIEAEVEVLAGCDDRLAEQGIDVSAFDSQAVAADVAAIRQALGYDQMHLRAASYGAEVALRAAAAHPDRVASLLLSSPVDPGRNWVAEAPAALDRALGAVLGACAADLECANAFGDLRAQVRRATDRLVDDPAQVQVRHLDGSSETVGYTATAAASHLRLLLYLQPAVGVERMPAVIAQAAQGNYTPLATLGRRTEQRVLGQISHGQHYAVQCAGPGARLSPGDMQVGDAPLVADDLVSAERALIGVCDDWDVPSLQAGGGPPAPDVPALIVSGRFDPVTPPSYGAAIAERSPASVHVEVPDVGHGALEHLGQCGRDLAAAFVADPAAGRDTLPTGCVAERAYRPATQLEPILGG